MGDGGFGAKQGETEPPTPLNVPFFTEVIPPITFDDFRDSPPPPPMSVFSKQIWVVPPLNPSKVFGFSVTTDPPKILRPLPPGDK